MPCVSSIRLLKKRLIRLWKSRYSSTVDQEIPQSALRVDVVVIRGLRTYQPAPPPAAPGTQMIVDRLYDHLFIENKPPSHDKGFSWKDLIFEACGRLQSVCGNTYDAYLICAVGLKFMIFYWDPQDSYWSSNPS